MRKAYVTVFKLLFIAASPIFSLSQSGGISLYGIVDHALVTANMISGDGTSAVLAAEGPDPNDLVSFNKFRANNLSRFTPQRPMFTFIKYHE